MKQIIFVCGYLNSGKSTFTKHLSLNEYTQSIEVSDIVKKTLQVDNVDRAILQDTKKLTNAIAREIESTIDQFTIDKYSKLLIINGLRQKDIYSYLEDKCLIGNNVFFKTLNIWINCDEKTRKQRFYSDTQKNTDTFETAMQKDFDLGIFHLYGYFLSLNNTVVIDQNYKLNF